MNKSSKIETKDTMRAVVVKKIAQQCNVTPAYVYLCMRDSNVCSQGAIEIREKYIALYKKMQTALA